MINIALLGCGRIAKRHAELLGTHHIAKARLAGVYDISPEKAIELANKYQTQAYSSLEALLNDPTVHAVAVLTESGYHAQHSIAVATHKKHVIVEKPMALTLVDADQMIQTCEKNKVTLFVVKQNRFNVPVLKLREALDAGRFGKLILGTVRVRWCRAQSYYNQANWRGTWALDGGVLTNQASHHIDLLEWMMGEVESVFAKGITALADIETEDTAVVLLKFKNGALGVIEATTATRPKDLEGSISILGEKGTVEIGGFAVNELKVWQFSDSQPEDEYMLEKYSVNPPDVYGFGHKSYYDHVVNCLTHPNTSPLVDGYEGKKSLELITAIYHSIETGKEVFLNNPPPLKIKLGNTSHD